MRTTQALERISAGFFCYVDDPLALTVGDADKIRVMFLHMVLVSSAVAFVLKSP